MTETQYSKTQLAKQFAMCRQHIWDEMRLSHTRTDFIDTLCRAYEAMNEGLAECGIIDNRICFKTGHFAD